MWKYEFVILKHPGGDGEGKTEEIASGDFLAQNRDQALMLAGREIPEAELENISKLTVQLRKFDDNTRTSGY